MKKRLSYAAVMTGVAICALSPAVAEDHMNCTGIVSSDPAHMYDFKLGDWNVTWRNKTAEGGIHEFAAVSNVYAIMEGDMLIDEQRSDVFKGLTYRTYLPDEKKWIVRWLPALKRPGSDISAALEDCTPVERHKLPAQGGRPEVTAVTRFTDITGNSFKFRQDWSYDDGKTWIKDVLYYEAARITPQPE